jgi:hypothetical protein
MSESASGAVNRAEHRRSAGRAFKRFKGIKSAKSYSQLTHSYFQSEQYAKLSFRAKALLIDLLAQYRGVNNGDLTTAWSVMQRAGWRSKDLLAKATRELEDRGWILKTRQGDIHGPTLWALTFHGIDDCRDRAGNRKMDAGVKPDSMPLHLWRTPGHDLPTNGPKRRFTNKLPARLPGKPFPTTGKAPGSEPSNVTPLAPHLSRLSVEVGR